MGTKLLPFLAGFLLFVSAVQAQPADIIDTVSGYFKTSNSHDLAQYFESAVELSILTEENTYSKAQAEQILRDFFSRNKAVSVKILHRLTSNPNYKLAVLSLSTAKDKFRISISLNSNGERFLIKEIRIEYDKQ
jgi:hypothetical protein